MKYTGNTSSLRNKKYTHFFIYFCIALLTSGVLFAEDIITNNNSTGDLTTTSSSTTTSGSSITTTSTSTSTTSTSPLSTNTTTITLTTVRPLSPSDGKFYISTVPLSVKLFWSDKATNEDRYIVARKASNEASFVQIGTVGINSTSYIDYTVVTGQVYDYRIVACGPTVGCSEPMDLTGVMLSFTANDPMMSTQNTETNSRPLSPLNLNYYIYLQTKAIALTWTDSAFNEERYTIERKLSSETAFLPLSQQGANTIVYFDILAIPGVIYDYRVRACSSIGCSEPAHLSNISIPKVEQNPESQETIVSKDLSSQSVTTEQKVTTETKPPEDTTIATTSEIKTTLSYTPEVVKTTPTTQPLPTIIDPDSENNQIETAIKINNLASRIEQRRKVVEKIKDELRQAVLQATQDSIAAGERSGIAFDKEKIENIKTGLIKKIDESLLIPTSVSSSDITALTLSVREDIGVMRKIANSTSTTQQNKLQNIGVLAKTITEQAEEFKTKEVAQLYKDTNKDGISDYDSLTIYGIDPYKPSPASVYEGRKISASEKILLGFDPTTLELVKVDREEPKDSPAPVVDTYVVEKIEFNEEKQLVLTGRALPNSFVTIYIYSTPIIVTVKTDSTGQWEYMLDKELEDGTHTIYTAAVNNSGKIVAKSTEFRFIKTAEAATLTGTSSPEIVQVVEPKLFKKTDFIIWGSFLFIVGIILLIFIGRRRKQ
jgi:hypothetical protein